MTNFGRPIATGQHNLHVAFRNDAPRAHPGVPESAGRAGDLALRMLSRASSQIKEAPSKRVFGYAKKYFGMDAATFNRERARIDGDLEALRRDISGGILLKISAGLETGGRPVNGFVNLARAPSTPFNKPFAKTDCNARTFAVIQKQPQAPSIVGAFHAGNIHMEEAVFFGAPDNAARVLLHEACHKFLGAHDGSDNDWYIDSDGNGRGKFQQGALTKDEYSIELQYTADAMAWFITKTSGLIEEVGGLTSCLGCS